MEEKQITFEIKHPEIFILLVILGVVFILEAIVVYNSPVVFGDEGVHTRTAQYIAQYKEYFVAYPFFETPLDKWMFERPPYLHFLEASLFWVSGMSEILVKLLHPFVASFLIGIGIFVLVKRIYNKETAFLAAVIAITIPSFVTYSVLLYTDVLVTFFFSMFILTFILAIEKESKKYWVLAGLFGGLSFLTKSTAVFIFLIAVFFFLYQLYKQRNIRIIKNYLIVVGIIILISSGFLVRNYYYFKTPHCNFPIPFFKPQCAVWLKPQNVYHYEGITEQVSTEQNILRFGLMNYLSFAYGNVWFIIFALIAGLGIVVYRRNRTDILVFLALVTILGMYYRYFTGRAEDTARFALQWTPIVSLVAANYFGELFDFVKKNKYVVYGTTVLTLGLLAYYTQFVWLGVLTSFLLIGILATKERLKFLALIMFFIVLFFGFSSLQSKLQVMSQVKQFSPAFFEACEWVKKNLPEDVKITSNFGAAIVYNCQRNNGGGGPDVVLSGNLTLVLSKLKAEEVTHIMVPKFILSPRNLSEKMPISFVNFLDSNKDYFRIIYENGEKNLEGCGVTRLCDGIRIYEIDYTA